MSWYEAVDKARLVKSGREVVDIEKETVLLIYHQDQIFAINNACPHMRLPLQIGRVDEDCTIHCPWHRSAFDLRTGDVKDWAPWPPGLGPMLGKIRRERALPVYETKVEDGKVFVNLQVPED